jgi:hypothetical protein
MVAVTDWSATSAGNTTVEGTSIAEGCPPANINNGLRSIMAGVRSFYDTYAALAATVGGYLSASGGTFTGTQPIYTGEGAMLHNQANGMASGRVFLQAAGGAAPTMAPGDWLLEY